MNQILSKGDVVISNFGRDKGNYFIVIDIDKNTNMAYISDGNIRKLANPKKKNQKHLTNQQYLIESIVEKLNKNIKVFDSEIYSALKKFKEQN